MAGQFVLFWASGGAKFPKMGDFLPMMAINRAAKFAAASFILAGKKSITVQTNKQKQTNSKRYIHTLIIGMCG